MENTEQLAYMVDYLLQEPQCRQGRGIPSAILQGEDKFSLYRALCNVRPPMPVSEAFLQVQDAFLQSRIAQRGVVTIKGMRPTASGLYVWQGDITCLAVDAIVNAANSQLLGCFAPCHNCIDNIIHTYAGVQLRLACAEIMQEQGHDEATGQAKITAAYNLPSKYVLHTVGPIVYGQLTAEHEALLAAVYTACLTCALEQGVKSIAFCCVSTGEFRFPPQRAAEIAVASVQEFMNKNAADIRIIFNVFKDSDHDIYRSLLGPDC